MDIFFDAYFSSSDFKDDESKFDEQTINVEKRFFNFHWHTTIKYKVFTL